MQTKNSGRERLTKSNLSDILVKLPMKEREKLAIHPDLLILSRILPVYHSEAATEQNRQNLPVGLVFAESGKSIIDHWNRVADELEEKDLVFLLVNTDEGLKIGRRIAKGMVSVGIAYTEFEKKHLLNVGQRQFVGGFSFRFVYPVESS